MSVPSFVRVPYRPPRGIILGLFDGISLTSEQQSRAHLIIADALEAQLAVTLRNADGWSRIVDVQRSRDKALRELLSTDHDRSLFDDHATELQRRQSDLRSTGPGAPVVLRATIEAIYGGTLEIIFRADGMSDESMERASWQVVHAFRGDAEQLGVPRMIAIADILDRRDEFATYTRSVKRTFGRQHDGEWVPLTAP
jgi:hypothetical protein